MFGFALLASCMPCHDDWLNDRSSTPPVSSTMHRLTGLPAGAGDPDPEAAPEADADVLVALDGVFALGLPLLELEGLLLLAATASATMPVTAMAETVFLTTPSAVCHLSSLDLRASPARSVHALARSDYALD
jgi:hypothetical protein